MSKASKLIDSELDRLDNEAKSSVDPDQFGIYDKSEYIFGLGFAACQTYLASKIKGKDKFNKLSKGPRHRSNQSFALITNACANYWKHHDEWNKGSLSKDAKKTIETLEQMGADVWSEYPTSNIMYSLLSPHELRFKKPLPFLKQWEEYIDQ